MEQAVRIALLGCGTVGTEVAKFLATHADDLANRAGGPLELIGIAVRDASALRDEAIDRALLTEDAEGLIDQADLVIELIGGIDPARAYVTRALQRGATVVTGNKALLAAHGPELYDLAAEHDTDLYYEAAVAGAVPVVYGLRESLAGDRVNAVLGILNGTTNYILDEMTTKGLGFDAALAKAQELGFAEADPSADIDGHDAAAKCAILASLAFHTRVSIDDVSVTGIRDVTADDIFLASDAGYVIKLIASARRRQRPVAGIELTVEPTLIPKSHPLASVHGPFNAVVIEAEAADRLMFYGRGAGGTPTASAVLGDVVAGARHRVDGGHAPRELAYSDMPILEPAQASSSFHVDMSVADELGVLATIARAFASQGVSISGVAQRGEGRTSANLTVTTHETTREKLDATLDQLDDYPQVLSVDRVFRVERA